MDSETRDGRGVLFTVRTQAPPTARAGVPFTGGAPEPERLCSPPAADGAILEIIGSAGQNPAAGRGGDSQAGGETP